MLSFPFSAKGGSSARDNFSVNKRHPLDEDATLSRNTFVKLSLCQHPDLGGDLAHSHKLSISAFLILSSIADIGTIIATCKGSTIQIVAGGI